MSDVTAEQLAAIMPRLSRDRVNAYLPLLNAALNRFGINTPERQAAFLAQCAVEADEFRNFLERGPGGAPNDGAAYEGSDILGNNQPGDGARFIGRGALQLTGRYWYTRVAGLLGMPGLLANPSLAEQPEYAFMVSAAYWNLRDINAAADNDDFMQVTRLVTGARLADLQAGAKRYQARVGYWGRAAAQLGVVFPQPPGGPQRPGTGVGSRPQPAPAHPQPPPPMPHPGANPHPPGGSPGGPGLPPHGGGHRPGNPHPPGGAPIPTAPMPGPGRPNPGIPGGPPTSTTPPPHIPMSAEIKTAKANERSEIERSESSETEREERKRES